MHQSTAIILFARTAEAEAKQKFLLLRNGKANKNILQLLRQHALRTVKCSGLPYFIFSEEEQKGDSFAVKMTNAYEQVFALGYENVIAIGADVPSITTKDLLTAHQQFQYADTVCGPTQCGGSYLLGINRHVFDRDTFLKLAWQTDRLFNDVTTKFEGIVIMNELQELNDAFQLDKLRFKFSRSKGIAQKLIQLVNSVVQNIRETGVAQLSIDPYTSPQLLARAP